VNPVIIVLKLDDGQHNYERHRVVSAYKRNNAAAKFKELLIADKIKYIDKKRAFNKDWSAGLQLPLQVDRLSNAPIYNIVYKDDIVNKLKQSDTTAKIEAASEILNDEEQ
jgi:hypothetical protein